MEATPLTGRAAEVARKREATGLNHTLGIVITTATTEQVEAVMPITPAITQPFGFVHGGATIALLETVASAGGEMVCDGQSEQPFGVEVCVRHRKSGKSGTVRGVATLAERVPSRRAGYKLIWNVAAYDDEGDVMSDGHVVVKVVPKTYLAEREAERGR